MSVSALALPSKFSLQGNSEQQWKSFKQKFDLYILAAGFKKKSDEEKVALLLTLGGDELLDIYNSFEFPNTSGNQTDPATVLQNVLEKFDAHFAPRRSTLANRFRFTKRVQLPTESLDSYITKLKIISKECEYGDRRQEAIRDQLVFGCTDDTLREKFFREEDLTLDAALKIAVAHEVSRKQMAVFQEETPASVNKVTQKKPTSAAKQGPEKKASGKHLGKCKFCGQVHIWKKQECPAFGRNCAKCGGKNHFAVMCKKKSSKQAAVQGIQEDDDTPSDEENAQYVMKVSTQNGNNKTIMTSMKVGDNDVQFQVDCGASVNVIPHKIVPNVQLQPCDTVLFMWNSSKINPIGKCRIVIANSKTKKRYSVEFIVVKEEFVPILGKRASEQMNLITVNYDNICAVKDVISEYSNVFSDELGTLPGIVKLTLDPSPTPVAISTCRVPISMKKKVSKKLDDLEKMNVIAKVDKPTEWVSRLVVGSKKSGDIRLCIDPQALNNDLKREMHPLPVIDDVLPDLSKARLFSKFDLKNGFWHCVLDDESSYLTTFQTPQGRYRWLRLPFGLAVSSENFQKRLNVALEGLNGVICVADDILVYGVGNTDAEANIDHEKNVCNLLKRCRTQGIILNKCKTELGKSEISFLGHKVGKCGLKPDPEKIAAVVKMKPPQCVAEVQRLAGMVNYLAKFLPGLSDVMRPIRQLACKDAEWHWDRRQEEALERVKQLVTSSPVLAYYDQNKPLDIQCDASQTGLGATLLQDGRPISYASRALTPTETRYAQIEKEMLAVVFALTKFHQYTFGRMTRILSDHKPLQSIVKKPISQASRRLQGMLLKAHHYDFELEYQPGKDMHIADFLSRTHLPESEGGQELEDVNMIAFLPIRPERLEKIRRATAADETMNLLLVTITTGWPEDRSSIPKQLLPYFSTRDQLSAQDGLVFKGERVVIPHELRAEIKKAIHSSHTGIEGCLRRARECVFWPSMNAEIKEYIAQCDICNSYNTAQQKETLRPHELSDRPWERVGVDLFELNNQNFLVTVDYFSCFWEIDVLESTKTTTVIRKLKSHFTRYGIPSVLISDNGPQFTSERFQEFADKYDFQHRTSSPKYPQSNGMAESAVKTAKSLIKKAISSGSDPYLAILDYRNTPTQDLELSPAQRNLGRRTRTLLPMSSNLLQPQAIDVSLEKKRRLKNLKSAWYYNQTAKDLDPLEEGDVVRVKPSTLGVDKWKKATVNKKLDERSYEVGTANGTLRRNRQHLRKTPEHDNLGDEHGDKETRHSSVDRQTQAASGSEGYDNADVKVPCSRQNGNAMDSDCKRMPIARSTRNVMPTRFKDYITK